MVGVKQNESFDFTSSFMVEGKNSAYVFSVVIMDACPIKRLIICKVTPLCNAITANECLATCIVRLNGKFIFLPISFKDCCSVLFLLNAHSLALLHHLNQIPSIINQTQIADSFYRISNVIESLLQLLSKVFHEPYSL